MKPKRKKVERDNTTYYIYDDTPYAYHNAAKAVQSHLKLNYGIDTNISSYNITNEHPCGDDCICVDVGFPVFGNSYLGHTKEDEFQQSQRWWYSNVALSNLSEVDLQRGYVVCDADEQRFRYKRW